jgi:hypothetical protein
MFSKENDEKNPNGLPFTSSAVLNVVETVSRNGKSISRAMTIRTVCRAPAKVRPRASSLAR